MKAIIISDVEARALLDKLKLTVLTPKHLLTDTTTLEDMHRTFHYVVCRWLQEMGADVVGL